MDATRIQLKKLRADAMFGKKKHFNAADRKNTQANLLNVPALAINVILSSVLLSNFQKEDPSTFKWVSATLAILATLLTGLATYWKLPKQVEGHRRIAHKFLKVMKGCERLLSFEKDNLVTGDAFVAEFQSLATSYDDANGEEEFFTPSKGDFTKAREGIATGEETYLSNELE